MLSKKIIYINSILQSKSIKKTMLDTYLKYTLPSMKIISFNLKITFI